MRNVDWGEIDPSRIVPQSERLVGGLSRGARDKLERRIIRHFEGGGTFEGLDSLEKWYHAYYMTGGGCPSGGGVNGLCLEPVMEKVPNPFSKDEMEDILHEI